MHDDTYIPDPDPDADSDMAAITEMLCKMTRNINEMSISIHGLVNTFGFISAESLGMFLRFHGELV